jgi:glycosyltransferase involved in cell wall biosynthesis
LTPENNIRIVIVTQYFWPEYFPINDLALGLFERGHQVTVLTGIPNYPEGRFFSGHGFFKNTRQDYHGVRVVRAPLLPRGKGGRIRLAINFLSFALSASILAPLFCREKYDVIFVYEPSPITVGLPALVLKRLKSAPVFLWMQDLWPESLSATGAIKSKKILKMVEALVRFIYRGCDRILVQSRAFSARVESLSANPERILYYPNSAEEIYQPIKLDATAPERSLMPAGFCIMFAGNIGAAQDFATILGAAEKLRNYSDIHWIILGDGRMRPWVEREVYQRGLTETVHLLGRYPAEAMPRFFSLADVLLVTLRRERIFSLTIPSKVQAYLACARPVIAGLEGEGARVIEEAGTGIVCQAEDPEALSAAVLAMYSMSETEREAMGLRGRDYFEKHFERTMLLDRLERWMKEVLEEPRKWAS